MRYFYGIVIAVIGAGFHCRILSTVLSTYVDFSKSVQNSFPEIIHKLLVIFGVLLLNVVWLSLHLKALKFIW